MLAETNISVRDTDKGHLLYPECSISRKKTRNGQTAPLSVGYDDGNTISDSLEL